MSLGDFVPAQGALVRELIDIATHVENRGKSVNPEFPSGDYKGDMKALKLVAVGTSDSGIKTIFSIGAGDHRLRALAFIDGETVNVNSQISDLKKLPSFLRRRVF